VLSYRFEPVAACDMCGADPGQFRNMGLRLNRSQGLNPRAASGIAVSVKKCRNCELVFADPRPVPASFDDHYGAAEDYWAEDYFTEEPGYFGAEIATAQGLLGFRQGMRALDIGAGIGKAMKAMMAAGFDTEGFEPSPAFRRAAIERTGIPEDSLALAGVEDAKLPAEHFDFISFGAVLEHLQSPCQAIERAIGWLKPGGIIQAEVPSSRWLISRLVNAFYRLRGTSYVTNISPMHRPFHLFEFGLQSFEKHGLRSGYEVACHHFAVCSIPHAPRLLHPLLRWWMERTGTGMQLTVFLRKLAS
jgi:2-polyprenyl-3-methyl-5-hydroxy-6-metoxy-1,4-benzoquinol methylase